MEPFNKRVEHPIHDFAGHTGDDMRGHDWMGQAEVQASGGDEDLYAGMSGSLCGHDYGRISVLQI